MKKNYEYECTQSEPERGNLIWKTKNVQHVALLVAAPRKNSGNLSKREKKQVHRLKLDQELCIF